MQVLFKIAEQEGFYLKHYTRLSGGDINDVFLLETENNKKVIKLNKANKLPGLFKEEASALHALSTTQSFSIPKVLHLGELEKTSYLILNHIEESSSNQFFWESFAKQLASLHENTAANFGWKSHNYIGSLPQNNKAHSTSSDFYIQQRLIPQFKLALLNGFSFKNLNRFYKEVELHIPKQEKPALIHGDLWSGNFICGKNQSPVLIDPAICYASREMDLAMMQLFGGFPNMVFNEYQQHFPLDTGWVERIEMYQLYYLLVHLNLFGASYLQQVQQIIKKYL